MASEKLDKKDKKDKKRSDESGVKKDKKDKKEKKERKEKLAAALDQKLQQDAAAQATPSKAKAAAADNDDDSDIENGVDLSKVPLDRTCVPFAVPVADLKGHKKVFKVVKKASKNGAIKRGVKEVVKALRTSNSSANKSKPSSPSVVIMAGDISPADVISHIPVLCENNKVPFIFVTSRAELGAYAKTKRPTSVVMVSEKGEGKRAKEESDEDKKEYVETFGGLVKYVEKEYQKQAFWIQGEQRDGGL